MSNSAKAIKKSKGPKWPWFIITPLILVGIFFRFYRLSAKEFWHDETITAFCLNTPTKGPILGLFDSSFVNSQDLLQYTLLDPKISISDVIKTEIERVGPVHPPLFYILIYFWAGITGSSVFALRALPATLSLLQIWGAFLLGYELAGSELMGGIAASLVALSPLLLVYAQELREYSMFQGLILITLACFLRALRKSPLDGNGWFSHTITMVLSLFSSLHAVFLMAAGLIFLLLRRGWRSRRMVLLVCTLVLSALMFYPWLEVILHNISAIMVANEWTSHRIPLTELVRRWMDNLAYLFVDFGVTDEFGTSGNFSSKLLMVLVISIEFAGLIYLGTKLRRRCALLMIVIAVNVVPIVACDLILGGFRSDIPRYFGPATMATIMAISYFLYSGLTSKKLPVKIAIGLLAVFLILVEIASDVSMSQATVWSQKQIGNQSLLTMASVINEDKGPVQIESDTVDGSNWEQIIALSRYIKPAIIQMLAPDKLEKFNMAPGVDHVYLLNISPQTRQSLNKRFKINRCNELDYFEIAVPINQSEQSDSKQ